ncbi:MAG: hypothetical protein COB59_03185 [Rhodospirillaceae bacterium]|nr:MAG: hypothetical protein COB59_03185 [Rhodospirillaceae bacterium]
MNRWKQQFKDHPIHETLAGMHEFASIEFENPQQNTIPERRRLLKLIETYQEILNHIDPELTPFDQLNTLNNAIRNDAYNNAHEYTEDGDVDYLTYANDALSSQLIHVSYLNPIAQKSRPLKPTKTLEKLVDSTAEEIIKRKNQLEKELDTLSDSIEDKGKELKAELETFSQNITERKTDLENELQTFSENIEELDELVETRKQSTDSLISEWQQQFSESQDNRRSEFNAWREKVNDKAASSTNAVIEKTNGRLDSHSTKFIEKIDAFILDAENKHQAILDLYELAAGDSVAGGYLQNANEEAKQANFWRMASIGFLFATVIWLATHVNAISNDVSKNTVSIEEIKPNLNNTQESDKTKKTKASTMSLTTTSSELANWLPKLLITFSVSGVLLWGSAYAAQQSTRHRNNEKRTRWFALEIKAIDPFISSLTPEQQSTLKTQLSERLFAQSSTTEKDTSVIDEHAFKLFGDVFAKLLGQLPKG